MVPTFKYKLDKEQYMCILKTPMCGQVGHMSNSLIFNDTKLSLCTLYIQNPTHAK